MIVLPHCPNCQEALIRIDHHAIEHLILEDGVYRPVAVADGMPDGQHGLASETDLRCGFCGQSVPRSVREYFFRRWYQVLETQKAPAATSGGECGESDVTTGDG